MRQLVSALFEAVRACGQCEAPAPAPAAGGERHMMLCRCSPRPELVVILLGGWSLTQQG
jgi:hypothetical protein